MNLTPSREDYLEALLLLEKENFKCPVFFQARLACHAFSDFGLLALNA